MNGGKCAVCTENKYELKVKTSKLSGDKMLVCNTCFSKKYEPRWLIILTAHSDGADAVKEFLVAKRYHGPEIPASELWT